MVFSDSFIPSCKDFDLSVPSYSLSTYGGEDYLSIAARASRFESTKKTFFVFEIEKKESDNSKSKDLKIYVLNESSTEQLDTLVENARRKLRELPAEERLEKLEETLKITEVAKLKKLTFKDESDFALEYEKLENSRALYHWSSLALSNRYKSEPIVSFL